MFWKASNDPSLYIWRFDGNPIVDLKHEDFWHICNSAVLLEDGLYNGVFRIEGKEGRPHLVYGESKDGIHFVFEDDLELVNQDGTPFVCEYCYDPRLVQVEGKTYVIFCADVEGPSIYIGLREGKKRFVIYPTGFLPFNRNGVLFPERVGGQYLMLNRPSDNTNTPFGHIYLSESDDMIHWGNHKLVMKNYDPGCHNYWERIKIGAGPAPIKTKEGWLLIYHGVQGTVNAWTYSFGVAILDLNDPSKVLYKAKRYFLSPEEPYETVGFCPNVIFPTTALTDDEGHVTIYYGCADQNIGVAFTTIDKLIEFAKKYN